MFVCVHDYLYSAFYNQAEELKLGCMDYGSHLSVDGSAVHMCAYLCVGLHVCVCDVYVHMCMMYKSVYVCVHLYVWLCGCAFVCRYVCVCLHISV